jgi:hypothetical protein
MEEINNKIKELNKKLENIGDRLPVDLKLKIKLLLQTISSQYIG